MLYEYTCIKMDLKLINKFLKKIYTHVNIQNQYLLDIPFIIIF